MNGREPSPNKDSKPRTPKWSSPLWYLPVMLLLLWLWQGTITQLSYKTISYSEFKSYLARGEVTDATVKEDTIEGKIQPKPQPVMTQPPGAHSEAATNTAAESINFYLDGSAYFTVTGTVSRVNVFSALKALAITRVSIR